MDEIRVDALVIGGGLAGLYAVLHLPPSWMTVVVDKGAVRTRRGPGSSPLAQGGMAVAAGPGDSRDLHAADTLRAGAGACVHTAVDVLTDEAPRVLADLVALGCGFDRAPTGELDFNREAGQSVARSVHWADATGREIMRVVVEHARERAERIVGTAERLVVHGGRCVGATVRSGRGTTTIVARGVLLATGGCGALYESTTNVAAATGDGVAAAFEAGAAVADLEFVQFHPTALARGELQRPLLTEALRGDGALVVDGEGKRFLLEVHPDGELAPRDVVARAIAARGGAFLDLRPLGDAVLRRRFPNVLRALRAAGFDPLAEPIPIAPAAHYLLGGVEADVDGRTSLPGLYAAGECAAIGVHGANRMAGNSLAEAAVFGRRAAIALAREAAARPRSVRAEPLPRTAPDRADGWACLRSAMTRGAGLIRTAASLAAARETTAEIAASTTDAALRQAAITAELICRSADIRDESRGVHFRDDHPAASPAWEGGHVRIAG